MFSSFLLFLQLNKGLKVSCLQEMSSCLQEMSSCLSAGDFTATKFHLFHNPFSSVVNQIFSRKSWACGSHYPVKCAVTFPCFWFTLMLKLRECPRLCFMCLAVCLNFKITTYPSMFPLPVGEHRTDLSKCFPSLRGPECGVSDKIGRASCRERV